MRGKQAPKRKLEGDVKFGDTHVAKLINHIMRDGKKSIAEKIVYKAFDLIKEETKQDPRHVLNKALKKISPLMEIRGRRVGGGNYQVPYQVRGNRRFTLSCRWLIEVINNKKGKPMYKKLAEEILAAVKGEGAAVKKREDVHRMAEANKAFAHFAR